MSSNSIEVKSEKPWLVVIGIVGVAIPIVVALLLFMPQTGKLGDLDFSILPHLNALLNSGTAFALLTGYYFVKKGNTVAHRVAMLTAFGLSSLFLVSYVLYHFQEASTLFGDLNHDHLVSPEEGQKAGSLRYVYYFLLLTHILLAAIIVPFVLLSIYYGLGKQIEKHKKVSKYTFPLWLYVAVTGVVVYLLISPYYIK